MNLTIDDTSCRLWATGAASCGTVVVMLLLLLLVVVTSSSCLRIVDLPSWLVETRERRRRRLPRTIVLVRHGESAANVDDAVWRTLPDNLVGLTARGRSQATRVGRRVEDLFRNRDSNNGKKESSSSYRRIHLIVSPFERALQTAARMRPALRHRIVRTDVESRIREQEMGNLQGADFHTFRAQQKKVGRFWYRFPTGESGADVLDRTKSWWFETVLQVNERVGYEPVDALVVVTHGLTIRFLLMQLYGWSPTTFHSVWNAENCSVYVLERDDGKPGLSPYVLDATAGDMPRSSIDVLVQFKGRDDNDNDNNGGQPKKTVALKLHNYLAVPPPRTTRTTLIGHMLARQYPDQIPSAADIETILFLPFIEGGIVKGRTTSGVTDSENDNRRDHGNDKTATTRGNSGRLPETDTRHRSSFGSLDDEDEDGLHHDESTDSLLVPDEEDESEIDAAASERFSRAPPETSLRFPCIDIPEDWEIDDDGEEEGGPRKKSSVKTTRMSHPDAVASDVHVKRLRFQEQEHETFDSTTHHEAPDPRGGGGGDSRRGPPPPPLNGNREPVLLPERSFFRFPRFRFPGMGCIDTASDTGDEDNQR